jgi:murein DD-endopeptidase MepM/ murein hydrolase activator NlpD
LAEKTQATPSTAFAKPETWLSLAIYGLLSLIVLAAVWLAQLGTATANPETSAAPLDATATAPAWSAASTIPAGAVFPTLEPLPALHDSAVFSRLADPNTDIPTRARATIETYTVVRGDTIFGIAAKFNLKPETILWGNPELVDNVNLLRPGKVLNILPIDGALRVVQPGDTLEKIAQVFHGKVEEIVAFPGNDLDPADPQLKVGQNLIIPGGWRETIQWSLPVVSRRGRGPGSSSEPGSCAGPFAGPSGGFNFIWPANNRYLSGWDYNPNTHPGIDIAAGMGAPIYASETGVVVFSGWSTRGYGNLVIIDHGNGWQTAYAHLSQINYGCGAAIYQGQLLGLSGSTGNSTGAHLHFEMRNEEFGRVNPWLYLR